MNFLIKALLKRVTPKKFRTHVTKLVQRKYDLGWNLRSGVKVMVATQADWIIYNDVFVDCEYDAPIIACLQGRNPAERLNVLDLGANVGYFTMRFIDLLRQGGYGDIPYNITMVEGAPSLFKEIQKRLALTEDLSKNIRVVNGLIGKREGSGRIQDGVFHPTNSVLLSGPDDVEVKYVDLTTLTQQPPSIDLLKCDIEGAELQFIENYLDLLRNVKSAVFEMHPQVCDYDRCMQLLESTGLKQSKILRQTEGFIVIHVWR